MNWKAFSSLEGFIDNVTFNVKLFTDLPLVITSTNVVARLEQTVFAHGYPSKVIDQSSKIC